MGGKNKKMANNSNKKNAKNNNNNNNNNNNKPPPTAGAGVDSNSNSSSNQKKRKVWRTVNVSAGGGPPQAMTPEQAAKYIQQATGSRGREVKITFGPSRPPPSSSASAPSSSERNNNTISASTATSSNTNTPITAAAATTTKKGSSKNNSINFGNLDLAALKETAAAAAAAKQLSLPSSSSNNNNKSRNNKKKKDGGLQCSEAEMKALMSMFVEIMGMSMDSPDKQVKISARSKGKKGPVFMFGGNNGIPVPPGGWSEASAETMAAATAGFFADGGASWDAIRKTYGAAVGMDDIDDSDGDDDDDSDDGDSLPDLDDMREIFKAQQRSHLDAKEAMMAASSAAAKVLSSAAKNNNNNNNNNNTTASSLSLPSGGGSGGGIAPNEWESLEKVAMDDALEAEDRARKAAKKREKKQRKKAKQKEEAALKAAEAAQKKREKSILSWRSRVVSACQSNEVGKLDALLQESPLLKLTPEEERVAVSTRTLILPHLEFLLPNSVAKNRSQLERGKEARQRLADYILSTDLPIAFSPLRSGRTALHTACFHGDLQFVQLVLEKVSSYRQNDDDNLDDDNDGDDDKLLPESYLNITCADSGWSPLHYAVVSGSTDVLETLLAAGCDTSTITDDTHTWRDRYVFFGKVFFIVLLFLIQQE